MWARCLQRAFSLTIVIAFDLDGGTLRTIPSWTRRMFRHKVTMLEVFCMQVCNKSGTVPFVQSVQELTFPLL